MTSKNEKNPKKKNRAKAQFLQLLDVDPNYKRWYENLERGSIVTANERARVLVRFLNKYNLTPQGLIDKVEKDKAKFEDELHDFITKLDKEGKAPGYQENYLKSIRSWLKYNRITLDRQIKIRDSQNTPTLEEERVPSKEELKTILNGANERSRVCISLMVFSGLRPQVMGDSEGTSGLQIKDFPELHVKGSEIVFDFIPTMIIVPNNLSKARHKYITFLGSEGIGYLKSYLERRIARGEKLTSESPIITASPGYEKMGKSKKNYGSRFVGTKNITKEIRRSLRPKFKWRPYVLRAYFDTQLMLAESHGKISHPYRQHFMGHKGDIEAKYSINKNRIPPELIEDMRRTYNDSEEYLVTQMQYSNNLDMIEDRVSRRILSEIATYGLNEKQKKELLKRLKSNIDSYKVQKENVNEKDVLEKEIELLKEEFAKRFLAIPDFYNHNTELKSKNGRKFKILTEDKLVQYLNEGWELVKEINGNKYLVRRN